MQISADTVQYINKITKKQSASMTWHEQRIGRITSSVVHRVLHTNIDNPSLSLMRSLCNPSTTSLDHVEAIKWGKEKESVALADYETCMMIKHDEFENLSTGLLISRDTTFIGASACSMSSCSCHGWRVVEVKCPYKHRNSTLSDHLKDPSSCLTENARELKPMLKYYSQVQLQMFVYDVKVCDFVVYTNKFTAVLYVPRNDQFIKEMLDKVKAFYLQCVLPELLTRRLEMEKPTGNIIDERLYCLCKSRDDGKFEMIGCDIPNYNIKWYHLKCLKMKRVPKGQWCCSKCKRSKKS